MARKLRIYAGERHDFEQHPDLVPFQMPPRKLREKGDLFELPPGFEAFNPQAYQKRYGHRLNRQEQQQQQPQAAAAAATAAAQQPGGSRS
jgi:hypothetical protein